jgi:hypothetical protein
MPRLAPAAPRRGRLGRLGKSFLVLALLGQLCAVGINPTAAQPPPPARAEASEASGFLSRHRRPLLIAAASGAAAAGVTAIVYRRKANSSYDEYQETADPEEIAALYADTEHLDEIAAGFFITAEVLFVAAIYLGFFVEPAGAQWSAGASESAAASPDAANRFTPGVTLPAGKSPRIALEWRF